MSEVLTLDNHKLSIRKLVLYNDNAILGQNKVLENEFVIRTRCFFFNVFFTSSSRYILWQKIFDSVLCGSWRRCCYARWALQSVCLHDRSHSPRPPRHFELVWKEHRWGQANVNAITGFFVFIQAHSKVPVFDLKFEVYWQNILGKWKSRDFFGSDQKLFYKNEVPELKQFPCQKFHSV